MDETHSNKFKSGSGQKQWQENNVLVRLLLQLNEFGKTWIVYKFLFQKSRVVFGELTIYRLV
jgi:hypothetical protein